MPNFRHESVDRLGKTVKGLLDADSAKQARSLLRKQGLTPLEVALQYGETDENQPAWSGRISTAELCLATRQLSGLIEASLPLERALLAVSQQTEVAKVKQRLSVVRAEVLGGSSLADALAMFPRDFDALFRGLVSAGEATGQLGPVLEKLAAYLEARHQLGSSVMLAFVYPAIVVVVALSVVVGLLTYVMPQLVSVFESSAQELPWLTDAMISLSNWLRAWGGWAALGLILAILLFRLMLRDESARLRWHKTLLVAPMLGRILRGVDTSRFASTLAILVGSGVPLLKALETAASTLSNLALQQDVREALSRVREGTTLASALQQGGRFPPVLIHLIASGEQSGNLARMLERAAHEQSQELERRTQILTKLLEPVLVVFMGAFVLLIVLAIMLPIIDLNTMVQ